MPLLRTSAGSATRTTPRPYPPTAPLPNRPHCPPPPPACPAHVAAAVANKAYNVGVATELPRPHDLLGTAHNWMHNPRYRRYR